MTIAPDDLRTVDLEAARLHRRHRALSIRRLSTKVRKAEAAYEAAVAERDAELIACHGRARDAALSYEDLAQATGRDESERISKGRVIQIVQGRSEYSKAQARAGATEEG